MLESPTQLSLMYHGNSLCSRFPQQGKVQSCDKAQDTYLLTSPKRQYQT